MLTHSISALERGSFMPLDIIRGDIAQVHADAIVNSANPLPVIGQGVDSSLHRAAGPALLEERRRIGSIRVGHAVATSAGRLPAKIVVHTVGPVWQGGGHGELSALASCYEASLAVASDHACASVAFPLISTGTYGFPKDRALIVAKESIGRFLEGHEMDVALVVYDMATFQLSAELVAGVEGYLAESMAVPDGALREADFDAGPSSALELPISSRGGSFRSSRIRESERGEGIFLGAPLSLEDVVGEVEETFSERLLHLIDERGLSDPEVYKRANIDRRLFSKIRGNPSYQPKKKTALAFAVALRLDLDETLDLIGRAGYTLSSASVGDLIARYFLEQRCWDVNDINLALFKYGQPLIGS